MRKLALALAACAAGAAAPAGAAIITTNYTVSGGTSGTFTLDFNDATSAYTLTALNLTIPGGATTFTTANSGIQFPLGPILVLGANVSGVDTIVRAAGQDDFFLNFDATLASQTSTLSYFDANPPAFNFTNVTITQGSPTAPVPEPATWAMMLVGLGAIGVAARNRKPGLAVA